MGLATPAAAQKDKDPLEKTTIITLGERTAIVKKLDTLICVENDYPLLVAMRERNRSVGVAWLIRERTTRPPSYISRRCPASAKQ
jgi:hypothetical protein